LASLAWNSGEESEFIRLRPCSVAAEKRGKTVNKIAGILQTMAKPFGTDFDASRVTNRASKLAGAGGLYINYDSKNKRRWRGEKMIKRHRFSLRRSLFQTSVP
jgi:hypothetical protein